MNETFKERSARIRAEREERKRTRIQTDDSYVNRYVALEYAGEVLREQLENDPEFREYFSETVKEGIANSSLRSEYAASDEFKENLRRMHDQTREFSTTAEASAYYSQMAERLWADPDARERLIAIRKAYWASNPEAGRLHGERLKRTYAENPNLGQQISNSLKNYYKDPAAKQKASEAQKKANRVAEKSSRYLGPVVGICHAKHVYIVLRGTIDYKRKNVVRKTIIDALKREDKRAMNFIWMRTTEDAVREIAGLGYREITNLDDAKDKEYIVGIHKDTGHKVEFECMANLKSAGWHRGHVWNSIKTGCLYKGYQWSKQER